MQRQTKVHLFTLITILVWACGFPFTKLALGYFSPNAVGLLRYMVASIAFIPVVIIGKIRPPAWRDLLWFLAAGAAGFAGYMFAFNKGMETLSSATGSIIISTAPVITAILALIFLKERVSLLGYVAFLIEFAGVLILLLWDGVFSVNEGIFWALLAACLVSVYNLLQRRLTRFYTPLQSTAYSIFAGTVLMLIFLPESIEQLPGVPFDAMFSIVFMGLLSSALGYVFWGKALSLTQSTSTVTNYMFLTPFLSTLLGFVLVMEVPGISTFVGGAVILLGFLLFRFAAGKTPASLEEDGQGPSKDLPVEMPAELEEVLPKE